MRARYPWRGPARLAVAVLVVAGWPASARAQVAEFDTTHTVYYEAPTRSHMFVYSPAADVSATPAEWITVHGGYEADVVSGASVAVKAGPTYQANNPGVDVVSTASVHDVRNVGRGGFTLRKETTSLTAGYSYSTENDYKSNTVSVAARTDVYDHNTQFEISYARNIDSVCDRVQGAGVTAERFTALEDSTGCFKSSNVLRTTHDINIDGLQGSWSQSWTRIFVTQVTFTSQIVNGFQSNPYRSVILGEGVKGQEHIPENRARESLTLRANVYLRPLKAALRFGLRGYWDTWDVKSVTGEVEFEKYLGERLRLALHGRGYRQSGALFWSDDYTGGDPPLGPKGQYFTGDRELSPFTSLALGLRANYTISPNDGRVVGLFTSLKFGASADVVQFSYDQFTLAGQPITNARSYLLGLNLSALF